MSEPAIICAAWGSKSVVDTYLLVDEKQGLSLVPQDLLDRFKNPYQVTTFRLDKQRKLARAEGVVVLQSIAERGYFLQLPPSTNSEMSAVAARNEKLTRQSS